MGSIKNNVALFVVFNHKITEQQRIDAVENLGVQDIILLPDELRTLWGAVPPDIETISSYISPVEMWLKQNAHITDYVLIQGEFGATFHLVSFALQRGLVPVYSTSKRVAAEKHLANGEVHMSHIFQHQRFRKYTLQC